MATHPAMSAIAPEVSGLGLATNSANLHMFVNAYAKSIGKGPEKVALPLAELEKRMVDETLSTGIFNLPMDIGFPPALRERYPQIAALPPSEARARLWEEYCGMACAERLDFLRLACATDTITMMDIESLTALFGKQIAHDAHTLPHSPPEAAFCEIQAPALMITGWYDWGLNDALASWQALQALAPDRVRRDSRLLIAPSAHNAPGYREGTAHHAELDTAFRTQNIVPLLSAWYDDIRAGRVNDWPKIIYYMMGANEWRASETWPPPGRTLDLYLRQGGRLGEDLPASGEAPDRFVYDPMDPTPTMGGSIVSAVYPAGSVDVSTVQERSDVLVFTTPEFVEDAEIAGPLKVTLHASSSAVDTDFSVRLSDLFPDGRAIQLQSGFLRARYRGPQPLALLPEQVYVLEIDLWATANRFCKGHKLRLDISSADFPRFDRNSNLGGGPGEPIPAIQCIYHDAERPSKLTVNLVNSPRSTLPLEPGPS